MAEGTVQQLRKQAALPDDLNSVTHTLLGQLIMVLNSSFKGYGTFKWTLHIYISYISYTEVETQMKANDKYFLKTQRVIEEETQQKPLVSTSTNLMTRVVIITSCLHEIIPLMGRSHRNN